MHAKLSLVAAAILLCLQAIFCRCCQLVSIYMRSIFIDTQERALLPPPPSDFPYYDAVYLICQKCSLRVSRARCKKRARGY